MPKLRVRELVPGAGALCGGIFLDLAFFEILVTVIVGQEAWQKITTTEKKNAFLKEWQLYLKTGISAKEETYPFHLNGQVYTIDRQLILSCFEKIKPTINNLVKTQIEAIKAKRNGTSPKVRYHYGSVSTRGHGKELMLIVISLWCLSAASVNASTFEIS